MAETNGESPVHDDNYELYGPFADSDVRLIDAAREVERARRDSPPAPVPTLQYPLTEAQLRLR